MSASLPSNHNFSRLLDELGLMGEAATALASQGPVYQQFIRRFPVSALRDLSLDDYCVGKGNRDTFCWWLERGLEPELGRYMPGTSRGHIVYFQPDGAVYKNRKLLDLDDQQALAYTLAVQAAIADTSWDEDWRWVDDDDELYRRAGVAPRVTMGEGRKLRLLSAYHPDEALPINSSAHLGHFLLQLGCPAESLPSAQQPAARMLRLREYWLLARQSIPGLTTVGFMRALYAPSLGLAPVREAGSETELTITLTGGAVRNGYVRIPKGQLLFAEQHLAKDEADSAVPFTLDLPDGSSISTCVLANRNRIQARFHSLFGRLNAAEGDLVTLSHVDEGHFEMLLEGRSAQPDTSQQLVDNHYDEKESAMTNPLNLILYGPPGTGKTYQTIYAALQILDPAAASAYKKVEGDQDATQDERLAVRAALKAKFDKLSAEQQVRFVTFHQSFSYEDFVEGLRAETVQKDGQSSLSYQVASGVFKQMCRDASRMEVRGAAGEVSDDARIWKISIGGTGPSEVKTYCYGHQQARIGWSELGDMRQPDQQSLDYLATLGSNDQHTISLFTREIAEGDVLVSINGQDSIEAVGVVTGAYSYDDKTLRGEYPHVLPIQWLYAGMNLSVRDLNEGKLFTLKTVYQLYRFTWPILQAAIAKAGIAPAADVVVDDKARGKPHVLIIDEINRGNISRIFGELITLIEDSKRAGREEALEVVLPYSKERFSVPDNVYLIGTMNTADRSLAGLDLALRRRFTFTEMPPRPELLDDVVIGEVNIGGMLRVMNQRITVLLDADHCLGHAYFMPLRNEPTLSKLADIFRRNVLPLLQEYFFEDWQRIRWVLNDHRKGDQDDYQFVVADKTLRVADLFGGVPALENSRENWRLNSAAFGRLDSYRLIGSAKAAVQEEAAR